jgi:Histidine kinase-, DNA gyrase B-, and HSP90-like ATPase
VPSRFQTEYLMKLQVRVNERGALRNGRFAFTNKLTLVSELLQNARRAGATHVVIEHDAATKRLIVDDDGCGIADFQRLLSFNESGWDEHTIRTEHAFGLGFSKCLYAARRVTVTSRGQRLAFHCDEALDQAELELVAAPDTDPALTTVELEGVDLPQLDQQIDRITRGFPLPVVYNRLLLARQHSLSAKPYVATDIGSIYLSGADTGEPATDTALYLQGLPVGGRDRYFDCDHGRVDVIHVDPTRFMARMPDRTELIDADEQSRLIDAAVRQLWRKVLEDRKLTLPPAEFVERYYAVARRQNLLEVFDGVPVVPHQACSLVIDYPTTADEQDAYLQSPASHPTREEVESGSVRLAAFSPYEKDESHATLMYARAAGLTLVHPYLLGENHWVLRDLRDLNTEEVKVVPIEVATEECFDGLYVCEQVRLCERIEVHHGGHAVAITDDALFHDGAMLYPSDCRGGAVVKQVCAYLDECDHFDGTACEDDMRRLDRLVRKLRCPDSASVLRCMFQDLLNDLPRSDYTSLVGKTFRVALGASADEALVDLVA